MSALVEEGLVHYDAYELLVVEFRVGKCMVGLSQTRVDRNEKNT